jgi:UDP-N-acetylglucosamine--N-acetylmuramyl-(pentapeptide) pyrophosphoryl-undecaprenol N-acetylglucosamine transferase
LQEQNGFAGVTNKLSAEKARAICVAYDGMERFFPKAKIVVTGNPVRHEVWQLKDRETALKHFGLDSSKRTIFIVGGSLGAKTLNMAMEYNTEIIENQNNIQILWQCGKLYERDFKDKKVANLPNVKMLTFVDRMDLAYSVADVVISRAGALSISELCLVGKAAILVPSPNVAEDHQTKNAMALVEKNAAILVRDTEANTMISKALEILQNDNLKKSLSQNILQLGKPKAAIDIANVIKAVVGS